MGFFIRKAFRLGPVRLNLSKSGLGASVGVTGARVGLTSQGRSYVAGGRGGLYYREYVAGRGARRGAGGSPAPGGGGDTPPRAGPVTIEADTEATFEPAWEPARGAKVEEAPPPLGPRPDHSLGPAQAGPLVAGAALLGLAASQLEGTARTAGLPLLLALGLAGGVAVALRQRRRRKRAERFAEELAAAVRAPEAEARLAALARETRATSADVAWHARARYLAELEEALADRRLEEEELARLDRLAAAFRLPRHFTEAARIAAFRTAYLEAVADHALGADEEETLRHIRERLAIPPEAAEEELGTIERLAALRALREGALPEIEPRTRLRRGERGHFEDEGRLLKRRVLRRFQRDGRRHKVVGLVVDEEGTLVLTDRRLLLVHRGTRSIPLAKVRDVELDLDRNLIAIVRDDRKKPVLVSTPDGPRAAAILAGAAGL